MRKPMMAGNWKMNKNRDEALQFIFAVNQSLPEASKVETVICAQPVLLRCLVKRQGEQLRIGAQNMHFENSGAFTGEVSPQVLTDTGVEYVVIGHSERREMFNETDETVNKKTITALANEITPIVCCGETLEERETNKYTEVLTNQIKKAYANIAATDVAKTVIAYEPIWAIGTGKTATSDVADQTCGLVRNVIKELYGAAVAEEVRVLYGGSVKPDNVADLMSKENIDGALVGGASLDPNSFLALCNACVK
ncbi:MAG: triose-phosphate isomerase [bacterium]